MSDEAFRRIRSSSEAPDGEAFLGDLIDFHADRPAITEKTLGALTTSEGKTGYDVVVEVVPQDVRCVIELGCGNGPVLERILRARPSVSRVVGIDACAPELAIARARIPDARLELVHGAAQRLSLEDGCADAVLSHHAFYLFVPIEPVIAEIGRVLRPGGVFSFVTTSFREDAGSTLAELMEHMGPRTLAEQPHFRGWGDRRVWSIAGLESLFFGPERSFAPPLDIHEFVVSIAEPAEQLCDRLMRFFYSVQMQTEASRAGLRREWLDVLLRTRDDEGNAHFDMPSARVTLARR